MGSRQDRKSTMTPAEREVIVLRCQIEKLEDIIRGQPDIIVDITLEVEAQLARAQGYWRMGRAQNGDYWARWKWTEGPYKGHYCIGGHQTLEFAIARCLGDIDLVERGRKTPPYDAPMRNVNKYEQ